MEQQQYVGVDLHRRRSVIVRVDQHGDHCPAVQIDNDAAALAAEVAKSGEHPEVVLEATYGWYWAVDVLEEMSARVLTFVACCTGPNRCSSRVVNRTTSR